MGQSLVRNFIHIIFSTKHRQPLILPAYEEELHKYIGGICNNLSCDTIRVGGYTDHVHILCLLSKKMALMHLMEEIKRGSSKWMKTKDGSLTNFYWQDGYGAFSINPSQIDHVATYITNQHKHHHELTYQDEYRSFLKKYNVEYDEQYVWD